MFKQVYADGGNFEASTSYHRLATELFLSATLLAQLNGYTFSRAFMERLERMLEVIYEITKPDGTVPIIGDQDNGRLHRLKIWDSPDLEWKDFRPLLAIGSVLFNRLAWGKMASDHWEEAIWFYGNAALAVYQKSIAESQTNRRSTEFKDTGLYVMRANDIYVAVDLGPIGQNGLGGHAHNDTLSFELFASGRTWIQDPGTYVYTADYKARNLFRSTSFHNTIDFSGYEQNRFDSTSLFSLKNESTPRLLSWHDDSDLGIHLMGELQDTKYPRMTYRRSFFLDPAERSLMITDVMSGQNSIRRVVLHFAPGLSIHKLEEPYLGIRLMDSAMRNVWLYSISSGTTKLQISDGWISDGYGDCQPGKVVYFEFVEPQHEMMIMLPGGEGDISTRIESTLRKVRIF
jgi:hypothetical protein